MAAAKKQPKGQASPQEVAQLPEEPRPVKESRTREPRQRTTREREKKVYSWALLMESRHATPPEKEPVITAERGRPRLNVATSQTSMTLSKGDREAIEFWQEQLSLVLHRKVSMGETVGFLARACQERLALAGESGSPIATLQDLVQALVGGEASEDGK